jgi:hypothetical protein
LSHQLTINAVILDEQGYLLVLKIYESGIVKRAIKPIKRRVSLNTSQRKTPPTPTQKSSKKIGKK